MTKLAFGYNDGLVDGVKAAWGARFIVTQDGNVDVVPDRIDVFGDADRQAALFAWLDRSLGDAWDSDNRELTPFLRAQKVLSEFLRDGVARTREARPLILHQDGEGAIVANTNGSAGYCYVAAYRYDDLPDDCATKGLDRILGRTKGTRMKLLNLTTKYWSNDYGTGKITVRGGGHQVTVDYDHGAWDPHRNAVDAYLGRYGYFATDLTVTETDRDGRGPFPNTRLWNVTVA